MPGHHTTAEALDTLLAHGRLAVSTEEVAQLLQVPPEHVRVRMQPLARSGRVFSPARGLWVAVPPEYRTWRVIPGAQFIEPMMTHLGRDYYLGRCTQIHGVTDRTRTGYLRLHGAACIPIHFGHSFLPRLRTSTLTLQRRTCYRLHQEEKTSVIYARPQPPERRARLRPRPRERGRRTHRLRKQRAG